MDEFSSLTIRQFLEDLGSTSPAPGGGSVSAISAALASRLTEMVANLTLGREKYAQNQEAMSRAISTARSLSDEFMVLAESDTEAFNRFMKALSLPRNTEEEKTLRKTAMQDALKDSTRIPLQVINSIRRLSENSLSVALYGNTNAITDAAVSALLADAAAKGAALNARINLSSINDEKFVRESMEKMDADLDYIGDILSKVMEISEETIGRQ